MSEFTVEAELAGTVWKVEAKVGDALEEEDVIMIMESMKMEIPVLAPETGKLLTIQVAEGDTVREGQVLVTMTASS
jgi:acetyl-CoA carboxylase biotin carboxyl carrier protein|tara:strand:+ start:115 stop:342 length:228 start_codon:yes stop_codon:yes gene_type:complete